MILVKKEPFEVLSCHEDFAKEIAKCPRMIGLKIKCMFELESGVLPLVNGVIFYNEVEDRLCVRQDFPVLYILKVNSKTEYYFTSQEELDNGIKALKLAPDDNYEQTKQLMNCTEEYDA